VWNVYCACVASVEPLKLCCRRTCPLLLVLSGAMSYVVCTNNVLACEISQHSFAATTAVKRVTAIGRSSHYCNTILRPPVGTREIRMHSSFLSVLSLPSHAVNLFAVVLSCAAYFISPNLTSRYSYRIRILSAKENIIMTQKLSRLVLPRLIIHNLLL
jgi:hypothetical protein